MKALILILFAVLSSCADEKDFSIKGKVVTVEPYGWADEEVMKNDSIVYQVSPESVIWSVVLVETAVVPIWLTGYQLYEPIRKK